MTNPTSNFGWQMPTSTDLVTDLPADFEVFGQAVDTSLADLKGGTTGQVLSKASNTNMDFTWVTTDDANAIQNSIVDAKGDLVAASANDTPARLAVGANGETLVADSSTATGLSYQANWAAGKNKIINGNFGIWQRGTSFSTTGVVYCADRFLTNTGSVTGFSAVQSAFTAGTAPVAGYESQYYLDIAGTLSNASTGYLQVEQRIEDVRTFAGQTVTLSFWAKGSTSGTVNTLFGQNFGSGGSTEVLTATSSQSITTSWQRFTQTVTLASISGKTIGTGSSLKVYFVKNMGSSYSTYGTSNYTGTLSIWGVQVEAGSVATAFQTATGTIQGELAACQRYYVRFNGEAFNALHALSFSYNTLSSNVGYQVPATMRVYPTSIEYINLRLTDNVSAFPVTSLTLSGDKGTTNCINVLAGTGGTLTAFRGYFLTGTGSTNYVGFSAEL